MSMYIFTREQRLTRSDLTETTIPAGEYSLNIPSQEIGQGLIKAGEEYATTHTDRHVQGSAFVVIVDDKGNARFYKKFYYKPK